MSGLTDEDVPTVSSVALEAVVRAETAAVAPPRSDESPDESPRESPDEATHDEDAPTVQFAVSPNVAIAPRPAPPRPLSSKAKAVAPAPAPVRAPTQDASEDEAELDSITATAPRVAAGRLSLSVPRNVDIRTVDSSEEDLATEVKTMTGVESVARAAALVAAAAQAEPVPSTEEEEQDVATVTTQAPVPVLGAVVVSSPLGEDAPAAVEDAPADDDDMATVTTQAPAPQVGSVPDIGDAIRISTKSLMGPQTQPGARGAVTGDVPTKTGVDAKEAPTKSGVNVAPDTADEDDAEESMTSRALAQNEPADDYADDSVTTQALLGPAVAAVVGVRVRDDTGATTQKKAKAPASPADGDPESITTEAPGHLTNMLRVIASDEARQATGRRASLEDEEPLENKTAVMPNAPVKGMTAGGLQKHPTLQGMGPVSTPTARHGPRSPGGARASAALPLREPSSESGLRVARGEVPSGEQASLGAIPGPSGADHLSSGRMGVDSQRELARASAAAALFHLTPVPGELAALQKPPPYGLLVTVVAAISIIIPVSLYMFLRHGEQPPAIQVPAQPSSDVVSRGDPVRAKAVKPPNKKPR